MGLKFNRKDKKDRWNYSLSHPFISNPANCHPCQKKYKKWYCNFGLSNHNFLYGVSTSKYSLTTLPPDLIERYYILLICAFTHTHTPIYIYTYTHPAKHPYTHIQTHKHSGTFSIYTESERVCVGVCVNVYCKSKKVFFIFCVTTFVSSISVLLFLLRW